MSIDTRSLCSSDPKVRRQRFNNVDAFENLWHRVDIKIDLGRIMEVADALLTCDFSCVGRTQLFANVAHNANVRLTSNEPRQPRE
jgi:hypothetical protein